VTHTGLVLVPLLACLAAPALAEDVAVIVHPERGERLDEDGLRKIYLKTRRFWSDGAVIVPVNRNAGSALRTAFDRALFGEEVRRLAVYWNREYFRGVLPPATLASDEAVLRFVAGEKRAIGYIQSSRVDDSVRAVLRFAAPGLGEGEEPNANGAAPLLPTEDEAILVPSPAFVRIAAWLPRSACVASEAIVPAGFGTTALIPADGSSSRSRWCGR